jgi:hypothetical protein
MKPVKKKNFDCVEIKRRIQEKIYEETKDMNHEQLIAYFRQRIANSRFADFLNQPEKPPAGAISR